MFDYKRFLFPLSWKNIKTRVKMISVILGLKTLLLLLVCDFGHGYYLCAQNILRIAKDPSTSLDSNVSIEDICPRFTWACGFQFLLVFTTSYLLVDIVVYLMFFLAEEQYSCVEKKERLILRAIYGSNVPPLKTDSPV